MNLAALLAALALIPAALAVVYGSYALARALQKHRGQRAVSRSALVTEPRGVSEP